MAKIDSHNLSVVVNVGDVHGPVVVEDVEDDIIGGVEEVADVNGGSTVQQNYMLYSLLTECSDI